MPILQIIVLVSKGKYNITFYRKDGHFSWPDDCNRATGSQGDSTSGERMPADVSVTMDMQVAGRQPHVVINTNLYKVRLAVISHSPDQQQMWIRKQYGIEYSSQMIAPPKIYPQLSGRVNPQKSTSLSNGIGNVPQRVQPSGASPKHCVESSSDG